MRKLLVLSALLLSADLFLLGSPAGAVDPAKDLPEGSAVLPATPPEESRSPSPGMAPPGTEIPDEPPAADVQQPQVPSEQPPATVGPCGETPAPCGGKAAPPARICIELGGVFFGVPHGKVTSFCQTQPGAPGKPSGPPATVPPGTVTPPAVPTAPPSATLPPEPPPEGWCCIQCCDPEGRVFRAPARVCMDARGALFGSREDAERFCRRPALAPPEPVGPAGWCCLPSGEVIHAPSNVCLREDGAFFGNPDKAEAFCRKQSQVMPPEPLPPEGFCCKDAEVFPAPEPICRDGGGAFFETPEQAEQFCRQHGQVVPPQPVPVAWCCAQGEVVQVPAGDCRNIGGTPFPEPEDAERLCLSQMGKPALGTPGLLKVIPGVTSKQHEPPQAVHKRPPLPRPRPHYRPQAPRVIAPKPLPVIE